MKAGSNVVVIDKLNKEIIYKVRQSEDKTYLLFLTTGSCSGELKIILEGKDAKVQILGVCIGADNHQINITTLQEHQKPSCVSDLLIKSVLFEESKLNFRGLIKIERGAQHSNAYQKNQNLLLSPKSRVDTRPYLEILANDVRCTHGATLGKINPDQLYYLQTRGLTRMTGAKLLIQGFFQDVVDRIPDAKLKKNILARIEKIINKKLIDQGSIL